MATWTLLGRIKPIHDQWVRFPNMATPTGEVFRCEFFGDIANANSYIWLRGIYSLKNGELLALRSTQIYPQEYKLVVEYPNPTQAQQYFDTLVTGRWFEVKKVNRFYRGSGFIPDTPWELSLAELGA